LDKTQEYRFAGEKETLLHYGCVNHLAENIDTLDVYIHHIHEDIHYYLGDFLQTCNRENILGVITQEDLNNDMQRIFNISNNKIHKKNNAYTDKYVSKRGRHLLKRYLYKDYACIDTLFSMGCLTQQQYDVLSK